MFKKTFLMWITAAAAIAALSGCAGTGPAFTGNEPVVQSIPNLHKHNKTVAVAANPSWGPDASPYFRISPDMWVNWVQKSITNTRAFSQIFYGPGADYLLNVRAYRRTEPAMFSLDQIPFVTTPVEIEAEWTLTDTRSGKTVMREIIKSSYAGPWVMDGPERYWRSTFGAAQENIRLGLSAISKLTLE